MPRNTPAPRTDLPAQTLNAIVERVRADGAVTVASLRLGRLAPSAEQALREAVERAGLEHTGKAIRRPLREQLVDALHRAGEIPQGSVARALRGARNAAEVSATVRALVEEGIAALVVHGRVTKLTRRSRDLLSAEELDAVAAKAKRLAELAKATKARKGKPRPTLLRAAVAEALGASSPPSSEPARLAVQAALFVAPTLGGLVRVPDVVRTLESLLPREEIVQALEALARSGALELRPEAGLQGLSPEDRARCVPGLDGTPLSYARRIADTEVRA